jgi:hypothetical protein
MLEEVFAPKVSARVVKYSDMPSRQWYMSSQHKDWYYHTPRTSPSNDLDSKFLDATLDPPVRLLALGLNSLGYTTLPSCSGHYKGPEELNAAYDNLVEDSRKIRKGGIELVDVENGNKLTFSDLTWHLPWDRATFMKKASGSESRPEGYLGFKVGTSEAYRVGSVVQSAVNNIDGCRYEVKRCPEGFIFELRVYTGKQKSQDAAWQDLGDSVMLGLTK